MAYATTQRFDPIGLPALAAGNFVCIGASDLVPDVSEHREMRTSVVHL